jgi:hypothetical protein
VCVYYCSTYYKVVREGGGGGEVEDMCYERQRAEAGVNKFAIVCVFIIAGPSTKLFTWGGQGIWEDMCYERRRAEACVD